MIRQHFTSVHTTTTGFISLCLCSITPSAMAAAAAPADSNWLWSGLMFLLVLMVTAASAALPLAALKQWKGHWRLVAALPLFGLLLWVVLIVVSKLIVSGSHSAWPLEIFAWAMLTMLYMVTVITAKRAFEKKDKENAANS